MYKYLILSCFTAAALVGPCIAGSNINICGSDDCCPNNTSLKCCCEINSNEYLAVKTKVSYTEAFILCKQIGMDLATIKSQAEENALSAYLTTVSSAAGIANGFWIGAAKWSSSTSFYWIKTGEPLVYDDFGPGQPDFLGSENCVQWIIYQPGTYGWNNWNCDGANSYVCQNRRRCI